ncbi:MAG: TIGR03435 family protein [Bryobacteraceae bacterium]|jgi:uncharacterized protein (TIGR03435 family)
MVRFLGLGVAVCACVLLAQVPDRSVSFEVASVKPAVPGPGPMALGVRGGPGSSDPSRFTATNLTLLAIILQAYDVPSFRLSAPSWLSSERFNIAAKVPPGTTEDQFRVMLQNLLADRFKLVAHRESRQAPVYALVIDRGGLRMKESVKRAPVETDRGMSATGKDGFPIIPLGSKGLWRNFNGDHFLIQARQETAADLAELLSEQLDRPVIDQTGLKAPYDFTLEFAPPEISAAPPADERESSASLSIFTAVKQLGLRLEPRKAPVEMVVVDSIHKTPTEN